jgi:hypothetical protein
MNVIKRNHGQGGENEINARGTKKDKWRSSYIEWEKIWGEAKTKEQWLGAAKKICLVGSSV